MPVATLRADSGVTMAFTDVDHVRFDDHVRSDDHVLSDDLASLRYRIRREAWTPRASGRALRRVGRRVTSGIDTGRWP